MGFFSSIGDLFSKTGAIGKIAGGVTGFLTGNPWISTALGAGLDMYSSAKANQTNIDLARAQMEFQERMSSTAYQRSRADAIAAGLSPVLTAQQGGASSPAGAMAQVSPVTARLAQNLQLAAMRSQIDLSSASAYKASQEARVSKVTADFIDKASGLQIVTGKLEP